MPIAAPAVRSTRFWLSYDHVVRIPGPHCYEFYGGEIFERHNEEHLGTFYLTDFLARHFDGLVWKGLGLDRHPELRDLYFANYTHVLYLQQSEDYEQRSRAEAAARKLNLEFAHADTGLDVLEARLVDAVNEFARRKGRLPPSSPAEAA